MLPKFRIDRVWGSEDIDVFFEDNITPALYDRVKSELRGKIRKLSRDERTIYHLERVVNGVFSTIAVKGNLGKRKDGWTLIEVIKDGN